MDKGYPIPTLQVQQVELQQGNEQRVVWVDVTWKLQPGNIVIGQDKREWVVVKVDEHTMDYHHLTHKRNMGGL